MTTRAPLDANSETALRATVSRAVGGIPGCAGASSSLWRRGQPVRQVSSHPDLATLLAAERSHAVNPVRAAADAVAVVAIEDTLHEARWPDYSVLALRQGIRCVTTAVTDFEGLVVTFTLYGPTPRGLSAHGAEHALALAQEGLAVVDSITAYDGAQRAAHQFGAALERRQVIEQAKGMIMQGSGVSAQTAFDELVRASQHRNLKISDVAHSLVDQHRADRVLGPTVVVTDRARPPRRRRPPGSGSDESRRAPD